MSQPDPTQRPRYDKDGREMPKDENEVRLIEGTYVLLPDRPPPARQRWGYWAILSCGLLAFLDRQTQIAMNAPQSKRKRKRKRK